jgi:hypothetical protein
MKVKPYLIISHLLPGCFFLLISLIDYEKWEFDKIKASVKDLNSTSLIGLGIILLIAAFLFGEIFDSARDGALEWIFEKLSKKKVRWDYFYDQPDEKKLARFEEFYFTWYVFNLNTAMALIIAGIVSLIYLDSKSYNHWFIVLWSLAIALLFLDALILRRDLVKHSQ